MSDPENPFENSPTFREITLVTETLAVDLKNHAALKTAFIDPVAELISALDHGRIIFSVAEDQRFMHELMAVALDFATNGHVNRPQRVEALLQPGDIMVTRSDVDVIDQVRRRSKELKLMGAELAVKLAVYEALHLTVGERSIFEIFNGLLAENSS